MEKEDLEFYSFIPCTYLNENDTKISYIDCQGLTYLF